MADRKPTSTSNFGVGRRENHDASAFYARFQAPNDTTAVTASPPAAATASIGDPFRVRDARAISVVPDNSVALVVTSPPSFAGKPYEEELDQAGVPPSYTEFLEMLEGVFA